MPCKGTWNEDKGESAAVSANHDNKRLFRARPVPLSQGSQDSQRAQVVRGEQAAVQGRRPGAVPASDHGPRAGAQRDRRRIHRRSESQWRLYDAYLSRHTVFERQEPLQDVRRGALLACEWQRGAAPAYFLHLEPGNSVIGGGIWQPEQKALKKLRDKIAGDPKGWGRATTGGALGSTCRMAGESLKRPPAGYDPAHPFIDDIKRKDFVISTPLTDQEVTGDDFLDLVLQRLRATAPFVQFLSNAVGLP